MLRLPLLALGLAIACLLASSCRADARPDALVFQADDAYSSLPAQADDSRQSSSGDDSYRRSRKIAIIGAGAGGSSAAYFLSKAQEKLEAQGYGAQGIDITVFERDERIGGRTTVVHPYEDESYPAVELGASIFADVNKNLQRASKQFNLATGAKIGEPGITGVWDGQQFLVEGLDNGWWNSAKFFWRYGYAPVTTQKLVTKFVDTFVSLYDPTFMHKKSEKSDDDSNSSSSTDSGYPWTSIEQFAKALKLDQAASQSAGAFFYNSGVAKLFVEEIIEAATLVNYGQDIYSIHGVGGSVSLAASGATGVVDGNYRIFESMLGHCQALHLRLGIHGEVTGLARFQTAGDALADGKISVQEAHEQGYLDEKNATLLSEAGKQTKWWLGTKSGYGSLFDAVFIATPWHNSDISLLNTRTVIPAPPYVHLHVTLIVTKADQPDPRYFGRGEKDAIPNSILTSHVAVRQQEEKDEKERKKRERGRGKNSSAKTWPWGGGGDQRKGLRLDFNSLTYLASIPSRDNSEGEDKQDHVVKLFSPERLSDEQLSEIFGQDNVLWTYRKEWDAYPYLTPRVEFPKIQADDNLYFLNAMETLVSTMETATVSARNAVALYLEQEYGPDFVHGGKSCPWQGDKGQQTRDDGDDNKDDVDWAAWGCQSA